MSAGVFSALIRFAWLPSTCDTLSILVWSHLSFSFVQVPSATFLGAITRTFRTSNRLYFSSFTAVSVVTVLPSPISRKSPSFLISMIFCIQCAW